MRYGRLTAVVFIIACECFAPSALAQQNSSQPQKWEYKIVNYCDPENQDIDKQGYLLQLGSEGWELVSVDTQPSGSTVCQVHYFKRIKTAAARQAAGPQCSITPDKAPTVRGLHLGMSADDLLSVFSPCDSSRKNAENALKDADLAPNYGLAVFTLYPKNTTMMASRENLAGVKSVSFKVFDGKVVEISAIYAMRGPDLYPTWTIDEWTSKISSSFSLPAANFWGRSLIDDQRLLTCRGLEIEASIMPPSYPPIPALGLYRTPELTITDTSYLQVLDQRVKADQNQKQGGFVF